MENRNKELLACIKAHGGSAKNTCAAVWDLIQAQEPEEGKRYFEAFLSQIYVEDIYKEAGNGFLSDEVLGQIADGIGDLGNRIVLNLVKQRPSEEAFYANLWEKLQDTALLPDREAQSLFLCWLWLDTHIPYYQIGEGCRMEEEEFARRKNELWPLLKKAFFILSFPLRQRTQRSSLLMELADELADERDRAVYWSCVIKRLQDDARRKERK